MSSNAIKCIKYILILIDFVNYIIFEYFIKNQEKRTKERETERERERERGGGE